MPKRSSTPRRKRAGKSEPDVNQVVHWIVEQTAAGGEPAKPAKNPHAQALGKLGGQKGGRARAEKLTPKERAEIATKAARARWAKVKG